MNQSAEAPASVTYSLLHNGYNMLFTVRGDSGMALLESMDVIESKLTEKGYKPQEKKVFGNKSAPNYVEGRKCPDCGQPLVAGTTKDGKKFIKCSTQKYDFMTKTTSGCKFTEWEQDKPKESNTKTSEFSESKCKDCGGEIKVSMAGKPYCSNRCWLPEGKHFREEFQKNQIKDVYQEEEIIVPDEMPF